MDKSLHVFVCSTYRDLVSERNAVCHGLESLSEQFPGFTFHCPRSIQPLESSKEEIRESDVLILILGHLHGVIAPGLEISHGEAEYNEAAALGKPVMVYLRDEQSGLYPAHFERDPARIAQLKAFREKLRNLHGAKVFDDLHSLVDQVTLDLFRLAQDAGMLPKSGPKTTKFKAKSWDSRRPSSQSAPAVQPVSEEMQTRTIPVLQKALSTPFRRRSPAAVPMGKTMALALVILALAGFALAKFRLLPLANSPNPTTAATPQAQSAPVEAAASAVNQAPPVPVAPRPSGSVAVTDDDDSTKAFLRKATSGSAEDQFRVGVMYEQGKDVPRNDTMAFRWYRKAAVQGLSEAQYKVALMYRTGTGTVKSSYQAAHWFQTAAEQGHPKAQVKLGQLYQAGRGVVRNETTAFKWFLKAADQKDPDAEKILAELKEN